MPGKDFESVSSYRGDFFGKSTLKKIDLLKGTKEMISKRTGWQEKVSLHYDVSLSARQSKKHYLKNNFKLKMQIDKNPM